MHRYDSDVLVIGSGGAGLRAAIEAAKTTSVTLVSKGPVGRSGATILAGADIMADGATLHALGYPGNPADNPAAWAKDILIEGFYLNDENLVQAYVAGSGQRVKELLDWGMTVRDTEERALLTTGMSICAALRCGLRELGGTQATQVDGVMIFDLLVSQGRAVGALGIDFETGEFIRFQAKAVILATGGWHQAYAFNAGADELTGDGQGMAYRAGAELVDMEMVTFVPNILLAPPRYRGSLWFYVLPGTLLNSRGDAFMAWEDPKVTKLALTSEWNKLLFSKASMREVLEGRGSPLGGVYFSLKHFPANVFDALEQAYPGWKFQGDDFSELMAKMREGYAAEVGPAAEYFEGGIRINERCETSLPGLYAAGECSGGLFGANRVAAATTEMVVEGAIAGREAAKLAAKNETPPIDEKQVEHLTQECAGFFDREDGVTVAELRGRLRRLAYEKVGVIRKGKCLSEACKAVNELEESLGQVTVATKRRAYNREWREAIELRNMLQCVLLSAYAARERTESRGVHVREDYPVVDNIGWRQHLVVRKGGEGINLTPVPVVSQTEIPKEQIPYEEAIIQAAEALMARKEVS